MKNFSIAFFLLCLFALTSCVLRRTKTKTSCTNQTVNGSQCGSTNANVCVDASKAGVTPVVILLCCDGTSGSTATCVQPQSSRTNPTGNNLGLCSALPTGATSCISQAPNTCNDATTSAATLCCPNFSVKTGSSSCTSRKVDLTLTQSCGATVTPKTPADALPVTCQINPAPPANTCTVASATSTLICCDGSTGTGSPASC